MAQASVSIANDTLAIAGVLDFESVLEINAAGLQWLTGAAPKQCALDLSAVTYSSSVGIALVLGWMRAAQAAGRSLALKNIPADMLALAKVGGLEGILNAA